MVEVGLRDDHTGTVETYLSKGRELLDLLASGSHDIWGPEVNSSEGLLKRFKEAVVIPIFVPIPSNSQFVERIIKEAAICSVTGRDERQRSSLAIARSRLYHLPKPDEEEVEDEQEISGLLTGDGSKKVYVKKETTSEKTERLLSDFKNFRERRRVLRDRIGDDAFVKWWTTIHKELSDCSQNQHSAQRQEASIENFESHGLNCELAPFNAAQRATGISYTAIVEGRVRFKDVVKSGNEEWILAALEAELQMRVSQYQERITDHFNFETGRRL